MDKNQEGFANIVLVFIIVAIISVVSFYFVLYKKQGTIPSYSITADNTFKANIDGYFKSCTNGAALYKLVNDSWEKVSNDLAVKGSYYLDNKFVGYSMCDLVVCQEFQDPYVIKLVEYKKVGEKAPPVDSGSTANPLPAYQTVPLSGDVKIDTQYFSDKNCQNTKSFSTIIKI